VGSIEITGVSQETGNIDLETGNFHSSTVEGGGTYLLTAKKPPPPKPQPPQPPPPSPDGKCSGFICNFNSGGGSVSADGTEYMGIFVDLPGPEIEFVMSAAFGGELLLADLTGSFVLQLQQVPEPSSLIILAVSIGAFGVFGLAIGRGEVVRA
jgi:hypothetical protein